MDTKKKQRTAWGGKWTEHKLNAFEKYVNAYLTIMNKHRDKNRWKLIYFDAFAGSGSRYSKQKAVDSRPFPESLGIEDADLTVYKGAAERVVCIKQRGFAYYYFIETDKKSRNELEKKLNALNHDNKLKLIFREKEEIRNYFYKEINTNGLFGVEAEIRKNEEPITRITELYIQRLRNLFPQVTDKPLEMRNSKNCPIYHFVFASNNIAAKKIAGDIIGKGVE
jgi:hypothetical protein